MAAHRYTLALYDMDDKRLVGIKQGTIGPAPSYGYQRGQAWSIGNQAKELFYEALADAGHTIFLDDKGNTK